MSISGTTRLLGLLGWPVAHSLSPAMHNAAAAALGLDLVYVALPVVPEQLPAALRGLVALNFVGVNVTVPHKQAVIAHLDAVDSAARAIGAVNTFTISSLETADPSTALRSAQGAGEETGFAQGDTVTGSHAEPSSSSSRPRSEASRMADLSTALRSAQGAGEETGSAQHDRFLHGFNTDHSGFLADLQAHGIAIQDRRCLILGAGGSARAVVYALARAGARVAVFARRPQQARQLVADLQPHAGGASLQPAPWQALHEQPAGDRPLIVNTTPVGMHPHEDRSPWPDELPFPSGAELYDLIYNPMETLFMRQARAAGCRAVNGLGMLLHQGAQAFTLWTQQRPPLEVMAAALRQHGIG